MNLLDFGEQRPSQIPIVVLDTETTGLHPYLGHRVVEIAAVRLENWQRVGEFSRLIQPERPMDPDAAAINGIHDRDLVGQPIFADVAADLLAFMDGALLVAHNAPFDAGFVGQEFTLAGYAAHRLPGEPVLPQPWLCTLQLARRHFYFGKNNLGSIARQLGVRVGRAHRALTDVYTTAEILKRMARDLEKKRFVTTADLLHAQGGPIYTPAAPVTAVPPLIAQAISHKQQLTIRYLSQSGETQRRISPQYVTENEGVAYLIATCHTQQAQRTFRLDKIFDVERLE
ncbi:MAG: WYL domain-containing protein [Chloroflexi bacterium]|nr:WYL domain-containing protein [Chloroflexota bacterium]MBP7045062.1 WYL domain-containing protein [Chloroflexota bacterium]